MSYRREEERAVYRDVDGVPVERRAVAEERVVEPAPVYEAAPVRDEVVHSDRVIEDTAADRFSALDMATRLIWFLTGLLLVGLIARFLLKVTAANAGSSFVAFIYNTTGPFVAPFRGIFADSASGNAVLEVSTIVAIVVWALIAFFVTWLLGILLGGPSRGVREHRREFRQY